MNPPLGARVVGHFRRYRTEWLLFALSLLLNLFFCTHQLPDVTHPDEPKVVRRAIAMGTGDLNPHFFLYPTLWIYLVFALQATGVALGFAGGWIRDLSQVRSMVFLDPTYFFAVARVLTAALGAGAVFLTVRLGRRLSPGAGPIAGLFLALFSPFIWQAHFATGDVPLVFFLLGCLLASVRYAEGDSSGLPWVTAIWAGLAVSIKWNGAAVLAAVGAALVWRARREGWPGRRFGLRALHAAAVAGVTLVATSPFIVLDFPAFRDGIREVYRGTVHTGSMPHPALAYLWIVLREGGPLLLPLAVAGYVWNFSSRAGGNGRAAGGITLAFAVPYLLAIQLSDYKAPRFLLPLAPVLAIGAAAALVAVASRTGFRRGPARAVVMFAVLGLVFTPIVLASLRVERDFTRLSAGAATTRWIRAHLPPGSPIFVEYASEVSLSPDRPTVERRLSAWAEHPDRKIRALQRAYLEYLKTPAPAAGFALEPTDSLELNAWSSGFDRERDHASRHLARVDYVVAPPSFVVLDGEDSCGRFYRTVRAQFHVVRRIDSNGKTVLVLKRNTADMGPTGP